jgi:hypothetical protein
MYMSVLMCWMFLSALISTGQRNTSDPMMDKEVGHGKKSELKL